MSELMRTRIAPRTHASGILVAASGSDSGSAGSGPRKDATDGKTPVWWCCRRASPRPIVSFVRVSAAVGLDGRQSFRDGSDVRDNDLGGVNGAREKLGAENKSVTRTAATETCAHAVHTFGPLHLAHEHVA